LLAACPAQSSSCAPTAHAPGHTPDFPFRADTLCRAARVRAASILLLLQQVLGNAGLWIDDGAWFYV
jgi:hypothetical protein